MGSLPVQKMRMDSYEFVVERDTNVDSDDSLVCWILKDGEPLLTEENISQLKNFISFISLISAKNSFKMNNIETPIFLARTKVIVKSNSPKKQACIL